jgi:hypothetical protein
MTGRRDAAPPSATRFSGTSSTSRICCAQAYRSRESGAQVREDAPRSARRGRVHRRLRSAAVASPGTSIARVEDQRHPPARATAARPAAPSCSRRSARPPPPAGRNVGGRFEEDVDAGTESGRSDGERSVAPSSEQVVVRRATCTPRRRAPCPALRRWEGETSPATRRGARSGAAEADVRRLRSGSRSPRARHRAALRSPRSIPPSRRWRSRRPHRAGT